MKTTFLHILGLLLCVIMITLQASCSLFDSGNHSSEPRPSTLWGIWNWQQSCGGFTGECSTPASTGNTMDLHLNQGGIFSVYQNDALLARGSFSIGSEGENSIIYYRTSSQDWPNRHEISVQGLDTLILSEGCCDRFTHLFTRE